MELKIRNADAIVVKKFDEWIKKHGQS